MCEAVKKRKCARQLKKKTGTGTGARQLVLWRDNTYALVLLLYVKNFLFGHSLITNFAHCSTLLTAAVVDTDVCRTKLPQV